MSKIALLIDAENVSHRDLPRILKEVSRLGQIVLRAVYEDWQRPDLQTWYQTAEANNFKIRHYTHATNTKNVSDMKLIMDAMEVLYRTPVEVFCLVTNDQDYVALCDKIREASKSVIGIGYHHAAEALIRACDQFIFIGQGESTNQPPVPPTSPSAVIAPVSLPKQPATSESTDQHAVRKLVSKAIAKAPRDKDGWVTLSALGTALRQVQADFQTSRYGHAKLSQLLQSMPDFVEIQANGNVKSARLKNDITSKRPKPNKLQKLVSKAIAKAPQDNGGWVTLSALGSALRQVQTDFQTKNHGHANLSKLLQSMPKFVEIRKKGGAKSARLRK